MSAQIKQFTFINEHLTSKKEMSNVKCQMSNASGFTLVELMVVVTIIAILTVIGITVFNSVQKNARDARRKADINAIANAMEANYDKTANPGVYAPLYATFFSSGAIPQSPTSDKLYCYRQGTASTEAEAGACDDSASTGAGDNIVSGKPEGALKVYWVVCANLEGTETYYCRKNIQ